MPTDHDYLRIALAGDNVAAHEVCGEPLAVVTQKAIRLAHDPTTALTWPQETTAIRDRVERQQCRRRLQHQRLERTT